MAKGAEIINHIYEKLENCARESKVAWSKGMLESMPKYKHTSALERIKKR